MLSEAALWINWVPLKSTFKTLSGMPCSCTLLIGSGLTPPPPQAGPVEAITTNRIQLHRSWPFCVEGRDGRLWCRGRLTSPVWKQLICSAVGKHEHSERSRDKQGKEGSDRIWSIPEEWDTWSRPKPHLQSVAKPSVHQLSPKSQMHELEKIVSCCLSLSFRVVFNQHQYGQN